MNENTMKITVEMDNGEYGQTTAMIEIPSDSSWPQATEKFLHLLNSVGYRFDVDGVMREIGEE